MTTRIDSNRIMLSALAALALLTAAAPAIADHRRDDRRNPLQWQPDRYEDRVRVVVDPPVYETRTRRVWIEPVYTVERVVIPVPPVFEARERRVWIPPVTEVRRVPVVEPAVFQTRRVADRDCHGRLFYREEQVCVRPARTVFVEQVVEVRPGCWRTEVEQVCVRPAGQRVEERRVCVTPGHWQTVTEQVCVRPAQRREVCERVLAQRGHFEVNVGFASDWRSVAGRR